MGRSNYNLRKHETWNNHPFIIKYVKERKKKRALRDVFSEHKTIRKKKTIRDAPMVTNILS